MTLNDIIQSAQGGAGLQNLASEFGLTPEQTQAAVQAIIPALTRAKAGGAVDTSKTCGPTPVAAEYALGQSIGVQGTPAIVTESGDYINGYMPPHDLVQELKSLQTAKGKSS